MPVPDPRLRPLGRLTRWSLPERDEQIERLDERLRVAAGSLWLRSVEGEARAVAGFTCLADELEASGADPDIVALARRASDDEMRHAELCRRVASAYLGREIAAPSSAPSDLPVYAGARAEVVPTLHAVALCCMQETTSSTFIEACLKEATAPLARAVLRELLADEIDHARIGWAHLSSPRLDESVRAAAGPWLLALAQANFRFWSPEVLPTSHDDAALRAHGCGTPALGAEAGMAATRQLIAPGLRHAGFVVPALDGWVATLPMRAADDHSPPG